jgi:hypothetical protein
MRRTWRHWVIAAIVSAWVGGEPRTTSAYTQQPGGKTAVGEELPEPVSEAIRLLRWSGDDLPRIQVVDARPRDATPNAQAWIRVDPEGRVVPIIFVLTDTEVYREAARGDYQMKVRLAGVLAHERWHLRHGPDEIGAYTVQLSTMEYLNANTMHLAQVRQALRWVQEQAGKKPKVR